MDKDENHKFGECKLCKQNRMLTWVLGQVKGSDRLFSGYICQECYEKAKEQNDHESDTIHGMKGENS